MRKPVGICHPFAAPLTAALVALIGCSALYAAPPPQPSQKQSLSRQDTAWLVQAHQTNLAEIKAGTLAVQRAHAHSLRQAAQTLVADHRMLDSKLKSLAGQLSVDLPASPSVKQQSILKLVESQQDMAFDTEWAHQEIDGHIAAIQKTKREIHIGKSHQVRQLAKRALPVLEKHLHLLRLAADQMTGGK